MSTAELIAEARTAAEPWVAKYHPHSMVGVMLRLADALEAATKPAITSWKSYAHTYGFTSGSAEDVYPEIVFEAGWRAACQSRVVSTVAELDALPLDAVLLSEQGGVWTKEHLVPSVWIEPGSMIEHPSRHIALPATVLWVGGTE